MLFRSGLLQLRPSNDENNPGDEPYELGVDAFVLGIPCCNEFTFAIVKKAKTSPTVKLIILIPQSSACQVIRESEVIYCAA